MARQPKLRKKNGYWMTKAGGIETYFGKIDLMPYAEARRQFFDHLKTVAQHKHMRRSAISVEVLCDQHLDWLNSNRSKQLYKQRQYLLSKWCDFELGTGRNRHQVGDVAATKVTAEDLLKWKQLLYGQGLGDTSVQQALAAVKSCWHWGVRHRHLPPDCKPFQTVEKMKLPPKALRECKVTLYASHVIS